MAILTKPSEDNNTRKLTTTLRNRANKGKQSDPEPSPSPSLSQNSNSRPGTNPKPLAFWFYFTITVSLITLLFVLLSLFPVQDQKSWFMSLPGTLREHYSNGRLIKVHINPSNDPVEVFTYSFGPRDGETVLIVHGLGCSSFSFRRVVDHLGSKGVFAVAIDLPGSGFSDKGVKVERERPSGVFSKVWDLYDEIIEKGLFWGFDNLVENGYIPYEEGAKKKRLELEPLKLGSQEVGRVLEQVVDAIGLAPVHLILHDSALVMGANWVSAANSGLLRSITLVDTTRNGSALPLWLFEVPIVREVVLRFDFVFRRVVDLCCSKSMDDSSVEAHRTLLKKESIVGMGKKLNRSFDLEEWANGVHLPLQVVWSSGWSREWKEEGSSVKDAIPKARFASYSGSRWPEEESAGDLAEHIVSFISTLPKTIRKVEQEPPSQAKGNDLHDGGQFHFHQDDEQMHAHAGYSDGYGLGHGWNT